MSNDGSAGQRQSVPASAVKKPWTAPSLDTYPAGSAENTFGPNRGDGGTGCGS